MTCGVVTVRKEEVVEVEEEFNFLPVLALLGAIGAGLAIREYVR